MYSRLDERTLFYLRGELGTRIDAQREAVVARASENPRGAVEMARELGRLDCLNDQLAEVEQAIHELEEIKNAKR